MSKLTKIFLIVITSLIVITIGCVIIANEKKKPDFDYDISDFHEIKVSEAINQVESGKTYVYFIGKSDCEVCAHVIPGLKEAQKNNNFTVQYIDIVEALKDDSFPELCEYFEMKSTQHISEDDSGEEVTDTYGNLLQQYGMTPTIIVMKNKKQTAGHIGGAKSEELIEWLSVKVN